MSARMAMGLVFALVLPMAGCALAPSKPAWELPPPPAKDAPVVDAASLHRTRLDNGLEILVLEDRRLPWVDLGVVARRGAAIEPLDRAGLASFTAQLMERGAGDRDALELAGVVDALGARLGVGSGWDEMSVGTSGLSRDLDTLLEVLADVTLRPRFDADEAARVKAETLASLEKAREDGKTLVRWNFAKALYAGHRYGLPASGTPESVAAFDAAQAQAFHASVFRPSNAIFYAVGDVDPSRLVEHARAAFAGWKPGDAPPPAAPPPTRASRRVVVVDRPDLGQAQIEIGHEGLARTDDRRIAAGLMNTVLGRGGFSSRLMSTVRAEEGLTYGISSVFSLRRSPGPFAVVTFTRAPEVRRVIDLVLAELERMKTEPPDAAELANAQSLRVGNFGLALETSGAVMGALVDLDVHGLPDDSLDTFRGRVRVVTPEDTARMARELLHPERAVITVVGPAEVIVPLLDGLGEIEVVQP